jgi:hypothetical protein
MTRIDLKVPFEEKDAAKGLGAKWDASRRTWYISEGLSSAAFSRWMPLPSTKLPEVRLYVDLVPNTAWFSNLRSVLTLPEWAAVKTRTFRAANYVCEICGGRGPNHPVECHERWTYIEDVHLQLLDKTVALCPACHEATHYGLARKRGRELEARDQLLRVNRWTHDQVAKHVSLAMADYERRSSMKWRLDARWLLDFVPFSEVTVTKIQEYAKGFLERHVDSWQQEIIEQHDAFSFPPFPE